MASLLIPRHVSGLPQDAAGRRPRAAAEASSRSRRLAEPGNGDHVAEDGGTEPVMPTSVVNRLDTVSAELAAMYAEASGVERLEVGKQICILLRELLLQCDPRQEEDSQPRLDAHADASVGTDDAEYDVPAGQLVSRRTTLQEVLATLDSGMMVNLAPCHGSKIPTSESCDSTGEEAGPYAAPIMAEIESCGGVLW